MTSKTCATCKQSLPATHDYFGTNNSHKDGLSSYCYPCRNANNRTNDAKRDYKLRRQKRRAAARQFVQSFLKEHPCACGETRFPTLQFDHLDPTQKSYSISNMVGKGLSPEAIALEIAKCQVLCANCHSIKTAEQFGWYDNLESNYYEETCNIRIV